MFLNCFSLATTKGELKKFLVNHCLLNAKVPIAAVGRVAGCAGSDGAKFSTRKFGVFPRLSEHIVFLTFARFCLLVMF